MGEDRYSISIFAPITGKVVDLSEVPDPVYAGRLMGDGVAIVPEDGTMFSPVTGCLNVIAEDKHAFGFTSDDGLEILVHIGVESKLQPDCCVVHQKLNSRVQAGDLIAEFNLPELQARDINLITPVIICGGLNGKVIKPAAGYVQAGSGEVIKVIDEEARAKYEAERASGNEKKAAQPPARKQAAESEAMDFLRDRANWPKLIGGFVLMTLLLVVVFVGVAMLIGH